MKKYVIEVDEFFGEIDLDMEFNYLDGIKFIINGLVDYKDFNGELVNTINDEELKGKIVLPLFATIHSGVYFQVGTTNLSKWDSGQAGYVIVDKDYPMEEIEYHIERLNSIYNGWYREAGVAEVTYCDCCGKEKGRDFVESTLAYTQEEQDRYIEILEDSYDVGKEIVEEKSLDHLWEQMEDIGWRVSDFDVLFETYINDMNERLDELEGKEIENKETKYLRFMTELAYVLKGRK